VSSLLNKIAIITGASSGIGRAAARLFASEGAKVVVSARRQAELDALVDEIDEAGGEAVAIAGDVRDEDVARKLVETARDRFGGLDIAFNNAGMTGEMAPVPDISVAGWRETIDTNLTSAFLAARHQIPAMIERGGGSIIFTATFVGYTVGFPILLSISIFYMASDVVFYCATVIPCTAPSPKRFSDGLIYVVTTVGGLVSALVIAQLSVTEPGSAPAVGTFAVLPEAPARIWDQSARRRSLLSP